MSARVERARPAVGPSGHRPGLGRLVRRAALMALLVVVCAVVLFPMYWQFLSVVQPLKYALSYNPPLVPKGFNWAPVQQLFDQQPMARWLWNTAQLSLLVTGICLLLSIVGAYVLSHLHWRAKPAFGFFILLTQMVPGAIVIVPVYRLYHNLHLMNNLPALGFVQAAFALPICTWILKNAFDAVPGEVMESALVEGCSALAVLWRILVPLSLPGLSAVAVVAFFFSWNEFLFAQTLISQTEILPGSPGIATMISELDTPPQLLQAAGLIFAILPVGFYIVVQRYVISGLTAGAIKG